MKENQSTTKTTPEKPAKDKKVLQLTESPETAGEKNSENDVEKVEGPETAVLREREPCEGLDLNEVGQSPPEERPSLWEDTPPAEKNALLREEKGLTDKDALLLEVKPPAPTVQRDPTSKCNHENKPLIQDYIPILDEVTLSVPKTIPFAEDSEVMAKQAESLEEEKTCLPEDTPFIPSTERGQPSPQKDNPLIQENKLETMQKEGTPTQINSFLTDGDTKLVTEKTPLTKDVKWLPKGNAPLSQMSQVGEAIHHTLLIGDNVSTTEAELLAGLKKLTLDDDSQLNEDEKRLAQAQGEAERISLEEEGKSSVLVVTREAVSFAQDETSQEEGNRLLTEDQTALVESHQLLVRDPPSTKMVKGKEGKQLPQVDRPLLIDETPSTEESSSLTYDNTPTNKEAEDDTFLAEEDTPLV